MICVLNIRIEEEDKNYLLAMLALAYTFYAMDISVSIFVRIDDRVKIFIVLKSNEYINSIFYLIT